MTPPSPSGGYDIGVEQLASMNREHNVAAFQQYGGARLLFHYITCFFQVYDSLEKS